MADGWRATPADGQPGVWRLDRSETTSGESRRDEALGALDDRDRAWVWVDGRTVVLDPPEQRARRGGGQAGHDTLAAPMPATVAAVSVAAGDHVQAGDTLVLLEAMKMEVPLRAPHTGIVTAVRCAVGDLVQPGTPLVEIDEEEGQA